MNELHQQATMGAASEKMESSLADSGATADGLPSLMEESFVTEVLDFLNKNPLISDIHVEENMPVVVKGPAGFWESCSLEPPSRAGIIRILGKLDEDWEHNINKRAVSRPLSIKSCRLRFNAVKVCGGMRIAISIRRLPLSPMKLSETGLPSSVQVMCSAPRGLILVAGATGKGKSTTVAAMIDYINNTRGGHVVSIENPIEYEHQRIKCIFSPREVHVDCESFQQGVYDALRMSPDVIVVGEIRDRETAVECLAAAESGHLVMATLHAASATGAIDKMLNWFWAHERDAKAATLANILTGVIFQTMIPSADRTRRVLAPELLFNNKQQFAGLIGDRAALEKAFLNGAAGEIQVTLGQSLLSLIKNKTITKVDAQGGVTYNQEDFFAMTRTIP